MGVIKEITNYNVSQEVPGKEIFIYCWYGYKLAELL